MYKEVLYLWFKGNGGGSGVTTMFEGWSDEKLEHFDIDIETYDHTDVSSDNCSLLIWMGVRNNYSYLCVRSKITWKYGET